MSGDIYFTYEINYTAKEVLEIFSNVELNIYNKYTIKKIKLKSLNNDIKIYNMNNLFKIKAYLNIEYKLFSIIFSGKYDFYLTYYPFKNIFSLGIPLKTQQEDKSIILELIDDVSKILLPKAIYNFEDGFQSLLEIKSNYDPNTFIWFIRDKNNNLIEYDYTPEITKIVNKYKGK